MKNRLALGISLSVLCVIGWAIAQETSTTTGEIAAAPPPPPMHVHPPNPLIKALDADADGVISAEEVANASAALAALDTNGDGALSRDELAPPRPQPPEDVKPGDHIMRLDADADGMVTLAEFTAPAGEAFARIDADGSGGISQEEAAAAPPPPGPPPPGCGKRPGPPPGTGQHPPQAGNAARNTIQKGKRGR